MDWAEFIQSEVESQSYEISIHADDERLADGLTLVEVETVLRRCELLEDYPDDPRGRSCLVLGMTPSGVPVHVVCGRNRMNHLVLITVYIPRMPKWRDPRTRKGEETEDA